MRTVMNSEILRSVLESIYVENKNVLKVFTVIEQGWRRISGHKNSTFYMLIFSPQNLIALSGKNAGFKLLLVTVYHRNRISFEERYSDEVFK
jgi:hypothetical protein